MAALSAQLRALSIIQGRDGSSRGPGARTRASLLFDPRKAADIDLQTIFSIAQAGLRELAEATDAFDPFQTTLFSPESTQTDRELQTKEFNDKLNRSIASFLQALSGFVLLPPAHQVLEYLIRRYKIHVYNVEEVMLCILPFHDTSIFVRMVQLLNIEKTRWMFLKGVKQSGAAPPREVLVQRCTHDNAFLEAVCDAGLMGIKPSVNSRAHVTFSCVTVMETLSKVHAVTKETLNKVMPFILGAFEEGVSDEYRVGGLMIVALLTSKASLSRNLNATLLMSVSRAASTGDVQTSRLCLMAMIQILQSQELDEFPNKAFRNTLKVKDFPVLMTELAKAFHAERFISLFVSALAEHSVSGKSYKRRFFEMLAELHLRDHVKLILSKLLNAVKKKEAEDTNFCAKEFLQKAVSAIEKLYPSELDSAVKAFFQEKDDWAIKILGDVFTDSMRKPLEAAGCSLYEAIDHPELEVRTMAVQQMSEMLLRPQNDEVASTIRDALLRRLNDNDLALADNVLSIDDLGEIIPPKPLVKSLCCLVHRCMDIVRKGPKSSKPVAKSLLSKCLKHVKEHVTDQDGDIQNEIQRCLLCHLLVARKTREENLQVWNILANSPASLYKFMPKECPEPPEEDDCRILNEAIVSALASSVKQDHSLAELLLEVAAVSDKGKRLSLSVLPGCFVEGSDDPRKLSGKCLPFIFEEWSAFADNVDELPSVEYRSDTYPDMKLRNEQLILLTVYRMIPFLDISTVQDSTYVNLAKSPAWEVFKPHLLLFLQRTSEPVSFLLNFSVAEGCPATVRVNSLSILAWYISEVSLSDEKQLELATVGSIVALSSPSKSVRSAAKRCVKAITGESQVSELLALLQALHKNFKNFIHNGRFISSFLQNRLEKSGREMELVLLLEQALKLPLPAQISFFEMLRPVSYTSLLSSATENRLLDLLHRRRLYHLTASASQEQKLTLSEIELMEYMLEINIRHVSKIHPKDLGPVFEALDVEGGSLADPGVARPCLLVLRFLSTDFYDDLDTSSQEAVFESLIELAAVTDNIICPSAQHSLDALQIDAAILSKYLGFLYSQDAFIGAERRKKIKRLENGKRWPGEGRMRSISFALLDFMLRKAKTVPWEGLMSPLLKLLRAHLSGVWPRRDPEISPGDVEHMGQLLLTVIESILSQPENCDTDLDADLLVEYLRAAKDDVTKNHAFSVIAAAGRRFPESFLPHVVEIVSIAGSSTITEDIGHFHTVVQQLLDSVVPFWLKQTKDSRSLLEVFLEALPAVPLHRQTDLVKCVLRVTDEDRSISTFLLLLIRKHEEKGDQWPLKFAERLCASYDSNTRVSALVNLSAQLQLESLQTAETSSWYILQRSTRFIAGQLQRLEVHLLDDNIVIQEACRTLMEHALQQLQVLSDKKLKALSEAGSGCLDAAHLLVDALTKLMSPSIFCKTVALLLRNSSNAIRRKVFQIYVSKLQEHDATPKKRSRGVSLMSDVDGHMEIVAQISKLLAGQDLSSRTKQAAISSLNVAVQKFGDECAPAFLSCLPAVLTSFEDEHKPVVVASVRCTASILSTAGAEALPTLPTLMASLLKIAQQCPAEGDREAELETAISLALEAAVDKLGSFLSPYIEGIIGVVISAKFNDPKNASLSEKVASVRKLTCEKLPARLLLEPLINSYRTSVDESETSTAFLFQMLATLCTKLDRASVAAYHTKVFDFCKEALDLRRNLPKSFTSVRIVEDSVLSAVTSLVMKLNETTFRPLFVTIQQWASSAVADGSQSIERSIVFYKLVNQLADKLRSVFVPYFRYLLEGCITILGRSSDTRKSKKRKPVNVFGDQGNAIAKWQLRHLVITSLHKCFLYDSVGFLDAPKFQQLLPPLADQLVEEAPPELDASTNGEVPTLAEADESLVSCLSRMALTAGTDVLWKPLNHEVLVKTRSGSGRAKRLALEVVKQLAENLREEYLVFVPETIPFLSELLEDQNPAIVAKTQLVIKLLEELSGESLSQYL